MILFTIEISLISDINTVIVTLQVYFGPEPDFWMVLTVGVPENGCRFVSNLTMRSLLITSYNLFTLFYGPFTPLMNKLGDLPTFRVSTGRLQNFEMTRFLV